MAEEKKKMNKMGTEPVQRLLLSMGVPVILSMVLQACYNIVDSMFVARMSDFENVRHAGEYGVNALTLAFPVAEAAAFIAAAGFLWHIKKNVLHGSDRAEVKNLAS